MNANSIYSLQVDNEKRVTRATPGGIHLLTTAKSLVLLETFVVGVISYHAFIFWTFLILLFYIMLLFWNDSSTKWFLSNTEARASVRLFCFHFTISRPIRIIFSGRDLAENTVCWERYTHSSLFWLTHRENRENKFGKQAFFLFLFYSLVFLLVPLHSLKLKPQKNLPWFQTIGELVEDKRSSWLRGIVPLFSKFTFT